MVVIAALTGEWEETQGGSGHRAFWGLVDVTQLAGLVPNSQGVDSPTKGVNWGRSSYTTTNRMTGGGTPPPTEMKKVGGQTGSGGYVLVPLPQLGKTGPVPPGGPK